MKKNFFFLILNIFLCLNLFSNHIFIFSSVDNLLLIIVLFIIINFYFYLNSLKSNFILWKKNEILKEYYIKLFNYYYFLNIYKLNLKRALNNINYLIFLLKFLLKFYQNCYLLKIKNYRNILFYLYNNFLNSFYFEQIIFKKYFINFKFKLKLKKYIFKKNFKKSK